MCNIKNIAHLSVRYKRYRTLILINTFQDIIRSLVCGIEIGTAYIGSPIGCDCGFEFASLNLSLFVGVAGMCCFCMGDAVVLVGGVCCCPTTIPNGFTIFIVVHVAFNCGFEL